MWQYRLLPVIARNEAISAQHVVLALLVAFPIFFCHSRGGRNPQGWGQKYQRPEIDPKTDLAMLLYTGGTTGVPKGAMHSHEVCIHSSGVAIPLMDATADDVYLALLPLYHAFGVAHITNQAIQTQASIVLMLEYMPEQALQLMEQHKVTMHHGAPTHILLETNHPNFRRYDLSSLRAGIGGGFAWPPELFHRAEKMMGLDIFHGWGGYG